MLVKRDLFSQILKLKGFEALLLWGPRQVGKTTLLDQLPLESKLFLDDLFLRERAQTDPALFFEEIKLPCLIDEVQYAPNLFPEIKLRIDKKRRNELKENKTSSGEVQYYLTGSHKTMLDEKVKESLAGRCHLFTLHGLSIHELCVSFPDISIAEILLKGGFPPLYTQDYLNPIQYLNEYIISHIEKDLARGAGVQKINQFQTILRLLAARSGNFLNLSELAAVSGVDSKTVKQWISLLENNAIVSMISPYFSNLSKRIVKMKKFYFNDVGLCARLQGHQGQELIWNSAHVGALFETLVYSEILKTKDNFLKNWSIHTWRTKDQKDQNEVDFILELPVQFIFIEAKLAIHGAKGFELDPEAKKVFANKPLQKIVVSSGGEITKHHFNTQIVPIKKLGAFLLELDHL